jgi:hemoglobin
MFLCGSAYGGRMKRLPNGKLRARACRLKDGEGTLLETNLFDKYGGFSTVSKIVMRLYDKLLDDDDVGPFFDDVDMPKLIDHQTKFVASLMGGPASFSDTHIERAHRNLTIQPIHFDRLKELIEETLNEFDLEDEDIEIVLAEFEARRDILVGAS